MNEVKCKTPLLNCRVTPKILYSTKPQSAITESSSSRPATKIVKIHSPFEYMHYIQRRQDYVGKQQELLDTLQVNQNNFEKLTYSIKQFGNFEGKFGVQSQRRFMGSIATSSCEHQPTEIISDRVPYCFKAKRLAISRRERRQVEQQGFFAMPPEKIRKTKSQADQLMRKARRQIPTDVPQIRFTETRPKFASYSRLLQEVDFSEAQQALKNR